MKLFEDINLEDFKKIISPASDLTFEQHKNKFVLKCTQPRDRENWTNLCWGLEIALDNEDSYERTNSTDYHKRDGTKTVIYYYKLKEDSNAK